MLNRDYYDYDKSYIDGLWLRRGALLGVRSCVCLLGVLERMFTGLSRLIGYPKLLVRSYMITWNWLNHVEDYRSHRFFRCEYIRYITSDRFDVETSRVIARILSEPCHSCTSLRKTIRRMASSFYHLSGLCSVGRKLSLC